MRHNWWGIMLMGLSLGTAKASVNAYEIQDASNQRTVLNVENRNSRNGDEAVLATHYRQPSGDRKEAGSETLRYLPASLTILSYHFEDLSSGEVADVQITNGKAVATYRESPEAEVKNGTLDWSADTYAGTALPLLISKRWSELQKGKTVDFELYVPFRLESVGFRLRTEAGDQADQRTIVAEARNWLIRQFAPTIRFVFRDGAEPELVKYLGPAPVALEGAKHKTVSIDFTTASGLGAQASLP